MAILLHMPEVAANMESATIVSWAKAEGDPVAVGDALADIETDKAVIEFTAEAAGVLGRILVPAGQAAAVALAELPDMNVSWTDEALLRHAAVDISVAVATENGLITPIVRQAEGRSLSAISADIARLAQRAREGRLQPQEYQGGSFTVSNLGMHGVREFAAIINPPQAAILAVGATERRAVVDAQGQLAVASMMSVTLSVDHRAIDGALAARGLKIFRRLIEAPLGILI